MTTEFSKIHERLRSLLGALWHLFDACKSPPPFPFEEADS